MSEYTDDQEATHDNRGRLTRQREQELIGRASDSIEQEKLVRAVEIAFDRALKKFGWFSVKTIAWLVFSALVLFVLKTNGWSHT